MLQVHCTNSNVRYNMSAITATVTTGTIMFGHCWIFVYGAELADQLQSFDITPPKSFLSIIIMSHNGAGWWFTSAGKAESSAGAWRCSATVRRCIAKKVDCSMLWDRTPRSSAGQWRSELWAREEFQSSQSVVDAFPRLKWPECTDRQGSAALYRVDISTPELLSWRWYAGELEASEVAEGWLKQQYI